MLTTQILKSFVYDLYANLITLAKHNCILTLVSFFFFFFFPLKVQKEIRNLLPSLSSSPISPENFRVYLILPFLLPGKDGDSFLSLTILAQAIVKLQPEGQQTLGRVL